MQDKYGTYLRRLCFTAVLVAMAVTMRVFFSISIPLVGENGMRVGFAGVFFSLPAILFGPVWGGIAGGLTDVLGHFMRPEGPYLPQITAAAVIGGLVRGFLWLLLRKHRPDRVRLAVLIFAIFMTVFGIANWVNFRLDGITTEFFVNLAGAEADTSGMSFISRWIIARSVVVANPTNTLTTMIQSVTVTPIAAGILGFILYCIERFMSARLKEDYEEYVSIMPLLIAMLLAAWIQNTLNTITLRNHVFSSWQLLPFWMVWFPRMLQATISAVVHAYFVVLLVAVCKRQKYFRKYLR